MNAFTTIKSSIIATAAELQEMNLTLQHRFSESEELYGSPEYVDEGDEFDEISATEYLINLLDEEFPEEAYEDVFYGLSYMELKSIIDYRIDRIKEELEVNRILASGSLEAKKIRVDF